MTSTRAWCCWGRTARSRLSELDGWKQTGRARLSSITRQDLSLLSHNRHLVALVSDDVADCVCLPLRLTSRSEPYELIVLCFNNAYAQTVVAPGGATAV